MPTNNNVALPVSFLQALEEARTRPHSFMSKNGQVKYLPFIGGGAEGDPPAADGEADSGAAGSGDANAETDGDPDKDGDSEEHEELPDNVKAILRKNRNEAREAQRKADAAERKAAEAEARAKQYEDRDKSELEKAQGRAEEAEKRAQELVAANKRLALRSAFIASNDVQWEDPEDALDLALRKFGLGDLEISDSGSVNKRDLQKIVKELAKEKPYLVKKEVADGGKPSGAAFNGNKGGKAKANNEEAMRAKYPAMAGRRRSAGT